MANEFSGLTELRQSFKSGNLDIPEDIVIDGIKYYYRTTNMYDFAELTQKNVKPTVLYTTPKEYHKEAKEKGLNETIVLIWVFNSKTLSVRPYDVRITTKARSTAMNVYENKDENIIGDTVDVRFSNFPVTLKGRVDTGATMCSLHADKWDIIRKDNGQDKVQFFCKPLSKNNITVDMVTTMAVKSPDGGVEYRPVIKFNVRIDDKYLKDISFNLNNRSEMDLPILIGQNALDEGDFLIDPKKNELDENNQEDNDIDFDEIEQMIEDIEPDNSNLPVIYDMLNNSDIKISDLLNYAEKTKRE